MSDKLEPLLDYLTDHKSGALVAESGRGRSYVGQCICAELEERGHFALVISLADYVSTDISALITPNKLLELQQADQAPIIILDGYEHLLNKGGSLRSVVNTLRGHSPQLGIRILVTCLPVDFALKNPAETLVESEDDDENVVFTAELQSMDADDIEDYVAFKKQCLKTKYPWDNEQANVYDGLLPWIEEQGLISHCRKPNDLAWLLELKTQHANQIDKFISLDQVIERQIRFELSYARQFYGDNSFKLAYENIELLAVASRLSGQQVHQIVFDYPFTLHGKNLLNVVRSGLINLQHRGWGRWEWSFDPIIEDWLIAQFLKKKLAQGMPKSALEKHLQIKVGGSQQLHHLLAGGAVFLSFVQDQKLLFESIIEKWPEQAVDLGDPSQLSSEDKIRILINIREKYRNEYTQLGYSSTGISRFVNEDVAEYVTTSIESICESGSALREDEEYLNLLCSLIRYGGVSNCSQPLLSLLESSETTNDHLWEEVVSTIAKVGNPNERERLLTQIPQLNDESDKAQILRYASRLFQVNKHLILNEINLEQFFNYLHPLINIQTNESISGFVFYIPNTLWKKLSTEQLKRGVINGLHQLLRQEDGAINLRYRWIIDPLGDVLKNFLSETLPNTEDPVWQIIIDLVTWKESLLNTSIPQSQFSYEAQNSSKTHLESALRDIFKNQHILRLWVRYQYSRYQPDQPLRFYHLLASIRRCIDSPQLAIEILLDNDESDEFRIFALRETELQALLFLTEIQVFSEQVRTAIREKIAAAISSRDYSSQQLNEPDPEHQQLVLEQQQSEEEFRQHMAESIEIIRSGEYLEAIQRLANMGGGGRSDFGFFPFDKISEQFGEDVAHAVKDGIIHLLDHHEIPCKSLSANESDGVYATLILQAITLESQTIQHFSGQRLRNTIAALTWELNKPPAWVDRLIRHHKEIARNILEPVIQVEAQTQAEGDSHRSLHRLAKRSNGHLAYLCWEIAKHQLDSEHYQCIETAIDATYLAIRYNNTDSACLNMSTLASENREHYLLQAYWLAIDSANGLTHLEGLVENNSEPSRTAITQILAALAQYRGENSLLKLPWSEINYLHRLLGILLSVLPANHGDMPEGIHAVTSEREITHLFQSLISTLRDKLNYEQGQQLVARLRSDERFNDFWWVDHIEKSLFNKEVGRPFSRQEVTQWIEGDWVQSIRTAGQLHDYIIGLLQDIKMHLASDDFSSAPLWQGLFCYKDKIKEKDRTEEEYVQVWLASELQRRSAGHLVVERENQTNASKRRDISVSIPHVGSCVIEIKVINKSRSYGKYRTLVDTINTQIPMYVRDYNYNAAILFMFKSDHKTYDLPEPWGRRKGLPELTDALTHVLEDLKESNEELSSLEALSVFGIGVVPRPLPKIGGQSTEK